MLIVFVHLGDVPAPHLVQSARQAMRVAPTSRVVAVLSSNTVMADQLAAIGARIVKTTELRPTYAHDVFTDNVRRRLGKKRGFWRYASERFFVLEEAMDALGAESALHLESDNLIFFDPDTAAPALRSLYNGLAAPFRNDRYCIPGVVWVGHRRALCDLNRHIAATVAAEARQMEAQGWLHRRRVRMGIKLDDMRMLAGWRKNGGALDALPVLPGDEGFEQLGMIFDAAAIGQFLYGFDPHFHKDATDRIGRRDEQATVDASRFAYDTLRLEAPETPQYVTLDGQPIRLASLHNHAKADLVS